jgi:hypothetical protein
MRRGARGLLATAAAVAIGLLGGTAAFAASPQQIYKDFADNGRLDAAYSPRELQAALQDPTVQGYGSPAVVAPMKAEIKRQLGAPAGQPLGQSARGGTLPFTGFDLALIVGGALVLLLIGGGLRRFSRART